MKKSSDAVITGHKVLTPIGGGENFRSNLFSGKSGITAIRGKIVPQSFPIPYAALIEEKIPMAKFLLQTRLEATTSRECLAAIHLTESIIEGLDGTVDGVIWGSAEGLDFPWAIDFYKNSSNERFPLGAMGPENSVDLLRAVLADKNGGRRGDVDLICFHNTCVTGNLAIGLAKQRINSGRWKRAIVGSASFRSTESHFMGMYLLGALSTANVPADQASCPFSARRSGVVRGEGAGILLLESREAAEARGAEIFGIVSGFSNTSDAWRLTEGREDALGAEMAIRSAINDAGILPQDISYINAHGTSTKLNDLQETLAIKRAMGPHAYSIPISSLKSQIGHTLAACGIIEVIACLEMLRAQKISPTINYKEADPECDLDYTPNHARSLSMNFVLSNSFAFGGQNSCLVLRAGD